MYEFKEINYGYLLSDEDAEYFENWKIEEELKVNEIIDNYKNLIFKLKIKNNKLKNKNFKLKNNSAKLYENTVDIKEFSDFLIKENEALIKKTKQLELKLNRISLICSRKEEE